MVGLEEPRREVRSVENDTKLASGRDVSVGERIVAALPTLTKKQRLIARYMADNEIDLAFASADGVGRQAGVDAATVVRFSRVLGYEGFADLRDAVRKSVPQFLTAAERVTQWLESGQSGDVVQEVFSQDVSNLEKTARMNTSETIAEAVSVLRLAPRVICVGQGISSFVADHLAHQLGIIGVVVQRPSRSIVDGAIDVALLAEDDAVVVVSVWRYLKHTLLLAEAAQERGASVIALTDSKAAPIGAHANITLTAATETPELSHSMSGLITLTNVLVTGVALANPERTLASLQRVDQFYEQFTVLAGQPIPHASGSTGALRGRNEGKRRTKR